MGTCTINECGAPVHAAGWCQSHYMRWYRYADPLHVPPPRRGRKRPDQPLFLRFWSKVDFSTPDGCWLWAGAKSDFYGEVWVDNEKRSTHRVAFEIVYGDLEPGVVVRHRCDTPLCVRPDHLVAGTQADNAQDMSVRRRWRNQHAAGVNNDPAAWRRTPRGGEEP